MVDVHHITAASTPEGALYGFVFKDCKISGSTERGRVYLGRPWRPYAKTVFIDCELSEVINQKGGTIGVMKKKRRRLFMQMEIRGPGCDNSTTTAQRVAWSHQLKKEDLGNYTLERFLGIGTRKFLNPSRY